jgi:hypothetical protein
MFLQLLVSKLWGYHQAELERMHYAYYTVTTGLDVSICVYPLIFQSFLCEEELLVSVRGQQSWNFTVLFTVQHSISV